MFAICCLIFSKLILWIFISYICVNGKVNSNLMCIFQSVAGFLQRREYQRSTEERKKASAITGKSITDVPKEYGYAMPFDSFILLKGWHDSLKASQEKFDKFVSHFNVLCVKFLLFPNF